jgi:hypothetical protein
VALDTSSFAAGLKVHYTDQMVRNMVYKDNPFFALCPKYEKFGGKNLPIPLIYGNPQGRSATFATAQANKGSTKIKDFTLTRVSDYSLASISNEAILASQGDVNAFMEAAVTEIDGAINSLARSTAVAMFRNGSGSIGQVANSSFTTTALTLTVVEDVTHFEVGMVLVLNNTDDATSVESGTLTVAGVDRVQGIVTTTQNLSTGVSTVAQNDYIFVQGDPGLKLSGLDAWLVDPSVLTSATFFGLDRTADASRLAGLFSDGSAKPIEESLIDAASLSAREGGKVDTCFVDYKQYANLSKALGSKVQYIDKMVGGDVEISFRGISLAGPRGMIDVIPDQNCKANTAFMLQLDTWKLYSLGKSPQILDMDGLKMLRESTADNVEVRVGAYHQLGCQAPGWNCKIKLA